MKKLLAIAALLSAPALAHANLVTNGSFEDYTTVTPGHYSIFKTGYGWTTGDLGVEIRNALVGTAADGVRFAELDSDGNSWISQTIHTYANQAVELSFSYAPRANLASSSNGIEVFWNGVAKASYAATGNANPGWLDIVIRDLHADANGLGVLTFAAIGNSDTLGGSLDNISVTAVPEPGSASMLLAGLGILAAMVRRRRA